MYVLIIGASVAGLAAADSPAAAGVSVRILEARDRIGGCIHTVRDAGNSYTQLTKRSSALSKTLGEILQNFVGEMLLVILGSLPYCGPTTESSKIALIAAIGVYPGEAGAGRPALPAVLGRLRARPRAVVRLTRSGFSTRLYA